MAKKKKENGKEEIPDVSPDLLVSDSVINRSQIYQDNSIHNTTNVYFPQESKKETKYGKRDGMFIILLKLYIIMEGFTQLMYVFRFRKLQSV